MLLVMNILIMKVHCYRLAIIHSGTWYQVKKHVSSVHRNIIFKGLSSGFRLVNPQSLFNTQGKD